MHNLKGQIIALSSIGLFFLTISCTSGSTYEQLQIKRDSGNVRAAAYAADGFTLDHRSPEMRPFRAWDFYYKNCALVSRNPYPNKSEFECADPR